VVFLIDSCREKGNCAITEISDKHLAPQWALVDPTLTFSMPRSLSGNTGIDAFSRAVES
jgi:alcohol dehydrogenase class IV